MRKTLSVRDESERTDSAAAPGRGWGVSGPRLDRLNDYARELRRNPTEPEKALWLKLRNQQLGGFKFKRQALVGSAIVDFACPYRWLVVEIYDPSDGNPEVVALRDKKLTDVGIRVMRFAPEDVMQDIETVEQTILAELQKPFERPMQQPDSSAPTRGPRRDSDA